MKKYIFALSLIVATMASAENKVFTYGNAQDGFVYGVLSRVSANGKWAVGTDEGFQTGSFIIDTANPSAIITVAGGELYDITNDGVAVGAWYHNQGTASEPIYYHRAAVYKDGQWTRLPEPSDVMGRSYARCVSDDGKYIGGMIFCKTADSELGAKYYPCLWTLDEATASYTLTTYNNLQLPSNMGFYVNDMTADGTTLVGIVVAHAGSYVPALVKNGQLQCWNNMEVKSWPSVHNGVTYYYDTAFIDGIQEGAQSSYWFNGAFYYIDGNYVYGHRSVASNVDYEKGTGTVTHNRTLYNLSTGEFTDEPSSTFFSCGIDNDYLFLVDSKTGSIPSAQCLSNGTMQSVTDVFGLDSDVNIAAVYGHDETNRVFACSSVWLNDAIGEYCETPVLIIIDAPVESNLGFTLFPSNANPVEALSGEVTITLPTVGHAVVLTPEVHGYFSDGNVQLYNLTTGSAPNTLTFTINPDITSPGSYEFVIKEGSVKDSDTDTLLPEIRFTYTIAGDDMTGAYRVSPSLDNITALDGDFAITLLDYEESGIMWGSLTKPCNVYMYHEGDDTSGRPFTWYSATSEDNIIRFTASPAITTPGDYIINISGFVRADTQADIDDINIHFTIKENVEPVVPDNPDEPNADDSVLLDENFDDDYTNNFPLLYDGDSQMPATAIQSLFLSDHGYSPWWVLKESSASTDRFMGSHSYYEPAGKSNDWLCSRAITIPTKDFILEFDAQSVVLREGERLSDLALYITEEQVSDAWQPTQPDAVFPQVPTGATPDITTNEWTHYSLSLNQWEGKTVYINFVNQNEDCDILCIDNVKVYRHEKIGVVLEELPEYISDEQISLNVEVTATDEALSSWKATITDGTTSQIFEYESLPKGQKQTITASFNVEACKKTDFTVTVESEGNYPIVKRGSTTRLAFRPNHRVLIEETTGLWCGNCPLGIYNIESLKNDPAISDNVVPVSVHISGTSSDFMAIDTYADYLGFANIAPMARLDRSVYYAGFSTAYDTAYNPAETMSFAFRTYWEQSQLVLFDIQLEAVPVVENGDTIAFNAKATVKPALNLDPTRYRVGFILTENNVGLDNSDYWVQENYFSGTSFASTLGGWTELPDQVRNMRFHYVARSLPAFNGIENSFTQLEAGQEYTVESTIQIPNTLKKDSRGNVISPAVRPHMCEITAYVTDISTYAIHNCARVSATEQANNLFTAASWLEAAGISELDCRRDTDSQLYDLSGRKVNSPLSPGIYIKNGRKFVLK